MLYAGKGVVGMDGLVALYFDAEPAHMRMIGKAAGDIAHHVLNKGRPRKGVFSHELLIFALEQRIDGRRAGYSTARHLVNMMSPALLTG